MPPMSPGFDKAALRRQIDDHTLLLRTIREDGVSLRSEVGGRRHRGRCPFHSERSPSFVVFRDAGYYCFGCGAAGRNAVDYLLARGVADFVSALAYLGLRTGPRSYLPPVAPPDPTPAPSADRLPARDPDVTYDYRDAAGVLRYQVCRWNLTPAEQEIAGKTKLFRQRRPQERGGWTWTSVPEAERLLYHLPEIAGADPGTPVWIVEGEKDANRLSAVGLLATTNSGGADHWPANAAAVLAGRACILVPDHDERGAGHARLVADELRLAGATVRILDLAAAWPACPEHGDVSDFLAAHHPDALRVLANVTPPLPALDPATGELLIADGAVPDAAVEALVAALQAQVAAGPVGTVADAALLATLQAQVAALEQEKAVLSARQAQIDALLLGNAALHTADRVGLYAYQRLLDERHLAPGSTVEVCQATLAKEWGVSADTVSRWMDRWQEMGLAYHTTPLETVAVLDARGRPVLDKRGQPRVRYNTRTVLNCAASPLDGVVTVLVSPPGKKGQRQGGVRVPTPCPACGAPADDQEPVPAYRCRRCHHTYTAADVPDSAPMETASAPTPLPAGAATARQDAPLPFVGSPTAGGASLRAVADAVRAEWAPAPAVDPVPDPAEGPPLEPDAPDYWQGCPRCHQVNPRRWPSGGWLCGCRFDPPIPPPPPPDADGACALEPTGGSP